MFFAFNIVGVSKFILGRNASKLMLEVENIYVGPILDFNAQHMANTLFCRVFLLCTDHSNPC